MTDPPSDTDRRPRDADRPSTDGELQNESDRTSTPARPAHRRTGAATDDGTASESAGPRGAPHDPGATGERPTDDAETSVPAGNDSFVCERCGRPFAVERHRTLHRRLAHGDDLTETERAAVDDAVAAEEADLRRFRIIALGALVVLYFGLLFAYAVFA